MKPKSKTRKSVQGKRAWMPIVEEDLPLTTERIQHLDGVQGILNLGTSDPNFESNLMAAYLRQVFPKYNLQWTAHGLTEIALKHYIENGGVN